MLLASVLAQTKGFDCDLLDVRPLAPLKLRHYGASQVCIFIQFYLG